MNDKYGLVYPSLEDYYDVEVTNGNFSKLADGIDKAKTDINAGYGNLEEMINNLDDNIAYVHSSLTNAVSNNSKTIGELSTKINTEVSKLTTKITNESTTINSRISSEVATINSKINGISGDVNKGFEDEIKAVNAKINSEVASLNTKIGNEVKTLDTKINSEVTSIKAKINSDIAGVNTKIGNESTVLNAKIDTEITQRKNDTTTLNARIDDIVTSVGDVEADITDIGKVIDEIKAGQGSTSGDSLNKEIIIAAYNSQNPLKAKADFVCTNSDCVSILNKAVEKVHSGGHILLLDGDFNFTSRWNVSKSVTIAGMGKRITRLNDVGVVGGDVIKLMALDTTIENIGIYSNSQSDICLLNLAHDNMVIDNCYFKLGTYKSPDKTACIYIDFGSGIGNIRVSNCLIEKYADERPFINSTLSAVRGTVYGNYVRTIGSYLEIPVRIDLKSGESKDSINCGAQKTAVYINNTLQN